MDETEAAFPLAPAAPGTTSPALVADAAAPMSRWVAGLEVFLVCGIPTQILVGLMLVLVFNVPIMDGANISLEFFATVAFIDTALIAVLIRLFLGLSGETSRDVFLGRRPIFGEVWRGLALLPVSYLAVVGIVLGLRRIAPWLHTVDHSPLEAYMRSPIEAAIFFVAAVLAGGVREELTRAFIIHRFGQRLGGVNVGLITYSVIFALLHVDQGFDAALAVGALGVLWGVLYIKRGSAVTGMVNHASFNAAQVIQSVIVRSFGG